MKNNHYRPRPHSTDKRISIGSILMGNFLGKQEIIRELPLFIFVCFLGIVYLIFDFKMEKKLVELQYLEKEVEQLRLKKIALHSHISKEKLYSKLVRKLERQNSMLEISLSPIFILNEQ